MPYSSKRQARWANASGQPFAKRWNKLTSFSGLPEHKDAGTMAGAPLSGPGGLLSTPGLGMPRKRKGKKWGMRTKEDGTLLRRPSQPVSGRGDASRRADSIAHCTCGVTLKAPTGAPGESLGQGITRIRGNLCNVHGRYGPCDAGQAAPKPKGRGRKPAAAKKPHVVHQTPAQKLQARDAEHTQNQAKVLTGLGIDAAGQAALTALRNGAQPDPKAVEAGGFEQSGLVEQASDGSYRMTASGRAALTAAQSGDAGRASSIISSARDRTATRQGKQTAAATRQQAVATRRAQALAKRTAAVAAKKPAKGGGGGGGGSKKPAKVAAPPAKVAPAPKARTSAPTVPRMTYTPPKPKAPAKVAAPKPSIAQPLKDAASAVSTGAQVTPSQIQQLVTNGLARLAKDGTPILTASGLSATKKSLIVYKDTNGQPRWLARTTTAYRDRDQEIIASDALDQDSQRMTAHKQYGPLRYWHVGQPDPLNVAQPWGPGLDIGDCDYSTLIGRTRVESGTFRDPAIAQTIARQSDRYELSPGFFHPLDQPDPGGVFNAIRTFERSIVPTAYGRAANLFTGLAVKEQRMDIGEMEKRFKAAITDLGLNAEQAQALGMQLVETEKSAAAQGIAFKSESYPDVVINGVTYKAFPPKAATAAPAVDMTDPEDDPAQGGDSGADEATEADGQMEGDYVGDMSVDDFKAMLAELLAPVLKMQDMVKSMGDMHGELKGMYGGMATKSEGVQAEIIALKARLAQIEGDQPATILPDDVAAALKSAGPATPQKPDDPAKQAILNDPSRPLAWLGMATFPELYQNGENG